MTQQAMTTRDFPRSTSGRYGAKWAKARICREQDRRAGGQWYVDVTVTGVEPAVEADPYALLSRRLREVTMDRWPSRDSRGLVETMREVASELARAGVEIVEVR